MITLCGARAFSLVTPWVSHLLSTFIRGSPSVRPSAVMPPPPRPKGKIQFTLFLLLMLLVPRCVWPSVPVSSVTSQTTESYSSIPSFKYLSLHFPSSSKHFLFYEVSVSWAMQRNHVIQSSQLSNIWFNQKIIVRHYILPTKFSKIIEKKKVWICLFKPEYLIC